MPSRLLNRGRLRRPLDQRSIAEAFSYAGIDPRQWVSYGLVSTDSPILFDPDYGPLVSVSLEPSKITVACRLGYHVAGNGEGEFYPFLPGDEVLVAVPGGNELGGCVILARMNNQIDKFPGDSVAGQDPTTNSFAFRRQRTAFIHEVAGSWMAREATSEAFMSIDSKGTITLRDGSKNVLQMSADTFSFQSGDDAAKYMLQFQLSDDRFTLRVNDAYLTLSGKDASPQTSMITTSGLFSLATNANPAAEHAVSTEAWVNLFLQWSTAMGPLISAIVLPVIGGTAGGDPVIGATVSLALLAPLFAPPFAAMATALGIAPTATLLPSIGAAIVSGFSSQPAKIQGIPGLGQTKPGLGAVGTMIG